MSPGPKFGINPPCIDYYTYALAKYDKKIIYSPRILTK